MELTYIKIFLQIIKNQNMKACLPLLWGMFGLPKSPFTGLLHSTAYIKIKNSDSKRHHFYIHIPLFSETTMLCACCPASSQNKDHLKVWHSIY